MFDVAEAPIVPISESTTQLNGDLVGRFVQNISMTPDFALTADLARAWWSERSHLQPDAVLSIDMPVIASLLGVSGPAMLPDGSQLTSDNLVDRVLVEPYLTLTNEDQTIFHRTVTPAALGAIFGGTVDPIRWMRALAEPIEQGRVSLWSADPDEQAIIETTALGGLHARQADLPGAGFGVFLNDGTAGKMDSFLDVAYATGTAECRADNRRDVIISIDLTNTAPPEATSWGTSMAGPGLPGVPQGSIATDVTVAAPAGYFFGGVRIDGERVGSVSVDDDNGFPSTRARVLVAPGQTSTAEFRFVAAERGEIQPQLVHTPTVRPSVVGTVPESCV
jgi:hypothetical protein